MVAVDCLEELLRFIEELDLPLELESLELESPLSDESFAELEELSVEMLELEDSSAELDDSFFPSRCQCSFSQINFSLK
jgi:hypothetical protein